MGYDGTLQGVEIISALEQADEATRAEVPRKRLHPPGQLSETGFGYHESPERIVSVRVETRRYDNCLRPVRLDGGDDAFLKF